jgi:hypothetical protein
MPKAPVKREACSIVGSVAEEKRRTDRINDEYVQLY